jgi:hypothetical protein
MTTDTIKPVDPKERKAHRDVKAGLNPTEVKQGKAQHVWVVYAFSEKLHDWVVLGFTRPRRKVGRKQLERVRVKNGLRPDTAVRAVELFTAAAFEHRLYVGELTTHLHKVRVKAPDLFAVHKTGDIINEIAGDKAARSFDLNIFSGEATFEVATVMSRAALETSLRRRDLLVIS